MADPDKAWPLVQDAILAFGSEVPDIAKARSALLAVLNEEAWRSYLPPIGKRCDYDDFAQWVKEKVPRGLDTTVENLVEIAEGETKLRNALDQVLRRPHGGNRRSKDFKSNNVPLEKPAGNNEAKALRRLRSQAPELHAHVLAGRLSAHGAMVKAGFRPKTITVPVARPEAAAKSLLKHMSADDVAKLIAVLVRKDG